MSKKQKESGIVELRKLVAILDAMRKVQSIMSKSKNRYEYTRIGTGESVNMRDYVHTHNGWYYVAHRNAHDSRFYGPIKGQPGNQFSCETLPGVSQAGGYRYEKHTRAVARAMAEFGIERRLLP